MVSTRWFLHEPLTEWCFVEPKMLLLWHHCEEPFQQLWSLERVLEKTEGFCGEYVQENVTSLKFRCQKYRDQKCTVLVTAEDFDVSWNLNAYLCGGPAFYEIAVSCRLYRRYPF